MLPHVLWFSLLGLNCLLCACECVCEFLSQSETLFFFFLLCLSRTPPSPSFTHMPLLYPSIRHCALSPAWHAFLRIRRHSTIFKAIMFIYSRTWKSNKAFETSKWNPFVARCLRSHATNGASSRNTFHAINTCRTWVGALQPGRGPDFDLNLSHHHTVHVFIDNSSNY